MRVRQLSCGDSRFKWLALVLAVALSLLPTPTLAAPQTMAWAWRNTPDWRAVADSGYAAACLYARAQTTRSGYAGDSLQAHGIKVWLAVQPWLVTWRGMPIKDWQPDSSLWAICERDSLWLRDSTGAVVRVSWPDVEDALVPDFSRRDVAEAWARALVAHWPKTDGWYLDYGDLTNGISWVYACRKVSPAKMTAWTLGYRRVAEILRSSGAKLSCWCKPQDAKVCSVWPFEGVGPFYGVGYPYLRVLTELRAQRRQGGRGLVFCERLDVPQYRRATAGVALLTDSWFTWKVGNASDRSFKDPEHFDLVIGTAPDTCWERAPGVWQRMFTRGFVIANVSTAQWFTYQRNANVSYVIGPGDALVVQTRDALGRYIPWRTNYGR